MHSVAVDATVPPPVVARAPPSTEYRAEYALQASTQQHSTDAPAGLPRKVAPPPNIVSTAAPLPVSEYRLQFQAPPPPERRDAAVGQTPRDEPVGPPVVAPPRLSEYESQYTWFGPAISSRVPRAPASAAVDVLPAAALPPVPPPVTEYREQFRFAVPPAVPVTTGTDTADAVPSAVFERTIQPLWPSGRFDARSEYADQFAWLPPPPTAQPRVKKVHVGDAGSTIKSALEFDPEEAASAVRNGSATQPAHTATQPDITPAPTAAPDYSKYQDWLEQLRDLRARAQSYKARDRKTAVDIRLSALAKQQLTLLERTRSNGRSQPPPPHPHFHTHAPATLPGFSNATRFAAHYHAAPAEPLTAHSLQTDARAFVRQEVTGASPFDSHTVSPPEPSSEPHVQRYHVDVPAEHVAPLQQHPLYPEGRPAHASTTADLARSTLAQAKLHQHTLQSHGRAVDAWTIEQ